MELVAPDQPVACEDSVLALPSRHSATLYRLPHIEVAVTTYGRMVLRCVVETDGTGIRNRAGGRKYLNSAVIKKLGYRSTARDRKTSK